MTIIDSQVHVYEANTPKRPWHSVPNWPDHVTGGWRRWTKSASTAPSSSPRLPCIATTPAMRRKCNELIPAGSPSLSRVFDAWGFDRCLWGTDWTRAYAVVNYEQAVEPFLKTDRLSESDRAVLMGGACANAYLWPPKTG